MEKAFEYKQIVNKIKATTSVTYPLTSGSVTITPKFLESGVEIEILFRPPNSRLLLSIAQLSCGYENFPFHILDLPDNARSIEIGVNMVHKLVYGEEVTEEFESYRSILEVILFQYNFHLSDNVSF
jgi:hypothetical protein